MIRSFRVQGRASPQDASEAILAPLCATPEVQHHPESNPLPLSSDSMPRVNNEFFTRSKNALFEP